MVRIAMLMCLIASPAGLAQTRVFITPPDPAAATQDPDLPFVTAQYPVQVDICSVARSLYPVPFGSLIVELPSGDAKSLQVKSASLQAGFEGGAEALCNDPGSLSYYLYATAYGLEMTLYVSQGRVSGGLTGKLDRLNQAWWINTVGTQHYLRDVDTSLLGSEPNDLEFVFKDGFEG